MLQVLLNTMLPYTERPYMEKLTIKGIINRKKAVNHFLTYCKFLKQ